MKRISAGSIFFAKYLFPVLWFGFLGFFVFTVLSNRDAQGGLSLFAIIVPVLMGIFGYFMLKKMVWDLADEVLDAGDSLVVRFGKEQERISLEHHQPELLLHDESGPRHTFAPPTLPLRQ